VIVLDTTVLAYAVGADHSLRGPCRAIIDAIGDGRVAATTTVEVLQEFLHVHARRGRRADAIEHARDYLRLLSPLREVQAEDFEAALVLLAAHPTLGAFDSVLAAVATRTSPGVLVSADRAFAAIPGLRHVDPADATAVAALLGEDRPTNVR
jgi:predicted nucleic acid-binding protein